MRKGPSHPTKTRVWGDSTEQNVENAENAENADAKTRKIRKMRMTGFNVTGFGWPPQGVFPWKELRGDRTIVMNAVSKNGSALQYATKKLRGDHEIVMTAVSLNGLALRFATEELRSDEKMMRAALEDDSEKGTLRIF